MSEYLLCIMWLTGSSGILQVLFTRDASRDSQVHGSMYASRLTQLTECATMCTFWLD